MANMAQAIRMALHYGETHLGVKEVYGEDVGPPLGGVFTATQGLKHAWDSPLDERGIVGAAIGLAWAGSRPVAEVQFVDYIFNAIDLLKLAGNSLWCSGGKFPCPMVLMTPTGSGIHGSIYHSHSFDSIASKIHGMKVVCPSTPLDAYGLMISAIKDDNPVLFLKPKALLRAKGRELIPGEPEDEKKLKEMIDAPIGDRSKWKPKWPNLEIVDIPIGQAKISNEGSDLTVVTHGRLAPICLQAAEEFSKQSKANIEVVDMRSLIPYDWKTIKASIQKTGRVLFVNEETEISNFGEHLFRRCIDEMFYELEVAPRLLCGKAVPGIGLNPGLEYNSVPEKKDVIQAYESILSVAA